MEVSLHVASLRVMRYAQRHLKSGLHTSCRNWGSDRRRQGDSVNCSHVLRYHGSEFVTVLGDLPEGRSQDTHDLGPLC